MADEPLSPTLNNDGQLDGTGGDITPGTQDPDVQTGQAQTGEPGTSDQTPGQSPAPETFFDPSTVSDDLQPAYKQMQAAFTKKMQGFSGHQDKLDAYDAFMSDPVGSLTKMAKQYGLNIGPYGQSDSTGGNVQDTNPGANGDFNPQTWGEVVQHIGKQIETNLMSKFQGQMQPVFDSVQKITASNIEQSLDGIDPMWRTYEDNMKATLKTHPTLVNDVSMLYSMSVPEEVRNAKAVQTALNKLKNTANASQAHGSRGTSKTAPAPKKAESFNDAVNMAKDQGRQEGWYK